MWMVKISWTEKVINERANGARSGLKLKTIYYEVFWSSLSKHTA